MMSEAGGFLPEIGREPGVGRVAGGTVLEVGDDGRLDGVPVRARSEREATGSREV
jgi:hypothetical protein